jgi:ankyrin repeat protein
MKSVLESLLCVIALLMTLSAASVPALAQEIHEAAEAGDVARVTEILAAKPDLVSAKNENGLTPMHLAARRGHIEVVQLLLDRGADLEETDERGFTALLYAAASGNLDLVQFLVDCGAAVDVVAPMPQVRQVDRSTNKATDTNEARGITAADVAFQHEVHRGQTEMTRYLVSHGAVLDPHAPVMRGIGKLDFAVSSGNVDMARLLIELGADPNAKTAYPLSPLFNASYKGNTEIAVMLLDAGADINAPSYEGMPPVVGAVARGHAEIVALLLDRGAELDFVDERTSRNLLHLAVLSGNLDVVAQLIRRGVPIDATDGDGKTPLYYSARYGHRSVYDRLLEGGATMTEDLERRFGRPPHLDRQLADGEAVVWYLNHRGWAIKTSEHLLVFDAEEFGVTRPTNPALANGFLTPVEIGDQDVLALYTCYHGLVGEPAYIHEIEESLATITYVHQESDPWRGSDATVYLSPHDQTSVGDVEIATVQVTERMPSLGYLVKVDGVVIYYAGFRVEDGEKFRHEIDFLAKHTDRVDLAFLQLVGPDEDDNEVRQFVERFDPRAVLILSPNRQEHLFPEMAGRLRSWGFDGEIFTAALRETSSYSGDSGAIATLRVLPVGRPGAPRSRGAGAPVPDRSHATC